MSKSNPFPGMNPWLEEHWPGVHSLLISCLSMQLASKLPGDLAARPEEGVNISAVGGEESHAFRADVGVKEPWEDGKSPPWAPHDDTELEARAAVPTIVQTAPMTERWIDCSRLPDLPLSPEDQEWLLAHLAASSRHDA